MPRNLDRRVEALVPVDEPELQARLEEILEVNLADDTLAWVLDADGAWHHVEGERPVDTHLRLQEIARTRARRLGLSRCPERWWAVHLAFTFVSFPGHQGFLRSRATTCHLQDTCCSPRRASLAQEEAVRLAGPAARLRPGRRGVRRR